MARYFGLGAGRDRAKAIAAYEAILQRGDSIPTVMVNLGEQLRSGASTRAPRRSTSRRIDSSPEAEPRSAMRSSSQLDQGKVKEAAATLALLRHELVRRTASRGR